MDSADEEPTEPERPFSLAVFDDNVLTGKINSQGYAEWDWARVPVALQLRSDKDHRFLKRNHKEFESEFQGAQLSLNEFHYRGKGSDSEKGLHSIESRGLCLMLCLLPQRKQTPSQAKGLAFKLLKALADTCMDQAPDCLNGYCAIVGTDLQYHTKQLTFSHGSCDQFGALLNCHSQAEQLWSMLQEKTWCNHKITSNFHHASLIDILFYILYSKSHIRAKDIWRDVGCFLWPDVLFMMGTALEKCATLLSQKEMQSVPLLKSKAGNARRVPFINKMVLLKKMKFNKAHRKLVMSSHSDLVPSSAGIVANEPLLECQEYLKILKTTFQNCNHIQVSWDPSNYSGDEVLVATIWSNECQTAGYLPIQCLLPVATCEVDKELQELSVQKRVVRVDGYGELRALAHALLVGVGKDFEDFFLPKDVLWQPLTASQSRVLIRGKFMVLNQDTGELREQVPDSFRFDKQPVLVSISDQGGVNRGVLDYACNYLKMVLVVAFDHHHRTWNDVKASLRKSGVYRSFLIFAMLYNVNYGPQGSKNWFNKKRAALKEMERFWGPNDATFLAMLPHICSERDELEDGSSEQRERLFSAMLDMKTAQRCGPLTKLMRWWSWMECHQFYDGEVWFTKLLMESNQEKKEEDTGPVPLIDPSSAAEAANLTPQQELRALKLKHGTWSLAPALVTEESFWDKTLAFQMSVPMWDMYSAMSKSVQQPADVLNFTIRMATGGWKQELAAITCHGCFDIGVMRKLYFTDGSDNEEHLKKHHTFLVTLLNKRAMSLVGTFCKPPFRYAGLARPDTEVEMRKVMNAEWKAIQEVEGLAAQGKQALPLNYMHFLQTSFSRLHYLANEIDIVNNLAGDASHGVLLSRTACKHLGDTVVVENTHQKCKDLLRNARHQMAGRLSKFHTIIGCNVLQGKKVNFVKVTDAQKSMGSFGKGDRLSVVKQTHPSAHKMSKRFQDVMRWKSSRPNFNWPSTSQETMFYESACLELLLQEGCSDLVRAGELKTATITCMVGQPGKFVASQLGGNALMVIAKAPLSFLGWEMEVLGRNDESGFVSMQLCRGATACSWHTVSDLDDWLSIPCNPKLQNRYGPFIYEQCSAAMPLPEAMVAEGLSLSVAQCLIILKHYDVKPASKKVKANLYHQIIELFVDNPEEQKLAFARSDLGKKKKTDDDLEGEDLSELEDLLDNLDEGGNCADPDVQKEKEKVKRARRKAFAQELQQKALLKPKKGKGKGRGKGKFAKKAFGRGKGKSKAKPKADPMPPKEPAVQPQVPEEEPEIPPNPSASASTQAVVPAKAEDEPDEKKTKRGTPAPKVHESPHHILDALAPPGAKMTLSTMDHRFVVTFKAQSKCLEWMTAPWSQKSYSKRFSKSTWQHALEEVHHFAWTKWSFASKEAAFSLKGSVRQTPGILDPSLIAGMDDWIQKLPTAKKYRKSEP